MEYTCSVCGEKVGKELLTFIDHTENHIIDEIKQAHPDWVNDDGICQRCEEYFRRQLKGKEEV